MTAYFAVLIVMTILGAVASLYLKKASGAENMIQMLKNVHLYIGGFLYLSSALLNIWILKYLEYSVVLPLTSFTYIWAMLLSYFILKEKITKSTVKCNPGCCKVRVQIVNTIYNLTSYP